MYIDDFVCFCIIVRLYTLCLQPLKLGGPNDVQFSKISMYACIGVTDCSNRPSEQFFRLHINEMLMMSYKKQELLTLSEHLSKSPLLFGGVCVAHFFFVLPCYLSLCSEFRVVMSVTTRLNRFL